MRDFSLEGPLAIIFPVLHSAFATILALQPAALLDDQPAAASFDYCTAVPNDAVRLQAGAILDAGRGAESGHRTAAALLVAAGMQIAEAAEDERACGKAFGRGAALFERTLARARNQLRGKTGFDRSSDAAIARVQEAVTEQWAKDQAARIAYSALRTDDRSGQAFWAQRLATANTVVIDAESTEMIRGLIARFGWIDRTRFGPKVSSHAWLLVQHADAHPDLQREALDRMALILESGEVKRQEYAYLWDRVAVNTGLLQRYGTQPELRCNADGTLSLQPVEDPSALDARRAEMGLGPAKADLERMQAERCG